MQQPIQRFRSVIKAVSGGYYEHLGATEIMDESTLDTIKIKVVPREGIHQNMEYFITLRFEEGSDWPRVFIDSEIYDKIKTTRYLQNRGHAGTHKGICIKNLTYGYPFNKNFKVLCDNKWENYVFHTITLFNNLQDFEKGNGLKSNYKSILDIN